MARYFISMLTGVALLISGVLYANDRGLWVWDKSDDIILNEKDRVEFYSFITAPHGNKNARITTIFISISPDFLISNQPAVQRFIADAHSRGISVQYLLGNNVFAMTDTNPATGMPYNQPLFDILDTSFFPYQIACAPQERFDALHVDIEPHGIGVESGLRKSAQPNEFWDWDNDTEALWSQFIDSLQTIQNAVNAHNMSYADSVQTGADIPFWYDSLPNRNGDPSAGNQDVQNTVDFITVMNYEVRTNVVNQICKDEIDYAKLLGKPDSVIVGFETQEISAKTRTLSNEDYGYLRGYGTIYLQTVSSWIFEGLEGTSSLYGDTETLVGIIEAQYDSPPGNFSSSFRGTAFHYYENIANSENAYRSIGKRQINSAPVCMLISPNGGEILSGEETVRYRLYDVYNDAVLVRVLIRMVPEQEWQTVSEAVILSSVAVSNTVVFDTMNPLLYSGTSLNPGDAVTTAEIRIEVNELDNNGAIDNDGLSGFDISDFPFTIVPLKHDALAPFDSGVAISAVPAGGYPVHGSLLIAWADGFIDDTASGANTSGIKGYWYSLYPQNQPDRAYFTYGFLGSLPSAVAGLQDVYVWAEDYCGNRSSAVHAQVTVYNDADCDGIADVIDSDIDGDGISNTAELAGNTDVYSPLSFNTAYAVGEWDFRSD
ncbi:thrombospondin type 3 repeat-containing protein, partial [bacterium]|nr:thrombospondin type 3 repeat-containing protein [bacterium]